MRILVVEDDPHIAAIVGEGLEDAGYTVTVAHDGEAGFLDARLNDYDLVVLDVMLPTTDGIEVARRLRAEGKATPILMLTARDREQDTIVGLDAGADDYLAKPFGFAELTARLRALTRRGARPRPTVLQAGDLRLDPASRQVWRGPAGIDLSATEFLLLELFLRNVDTVLTRTVITEQVWDWASDSVSNVVDQYVSYLRRKIDRPFGVEQLVTVRGAGYRLLGEPRPGDEQPTGGSACLSGPG